jgi:hypothetical protein
MAEARDDDRKPGNKIEIATGNGGPAAQNQSKLASLSTKGWLMILVIGVFASLPLYLYGLPLFLDLNHHYEHPM